jgi:hypothetical protein
LEENVLEKQMLEKEILRLKTVNSSLKKQMSFQEPVIGNDSADKFFVDRIDDLVKIEEIIVQSENDGEEIN